ncbi:hypothetical protein D9M70_537490 [compost metagenome]
MAGIPGIKRFAVNHGCSYRQSVREKGGTDLGQTKLASNGVQPMPFSKAATLAVGDMPVPTPTSGLAAIRNKNRCTRNLLIRTTIRKIAVSRTESE